LGGSQSIIEIPALARVEVRGEDIYGVEFEAIERNMGPNFGKVFKVRLQDPREVWGKVQVIDTPVAGGHIQTITPNIYSPSALQKFSRTGYIKMEPSYSSWWKVLKRREEPGNVTGEDTVLFYRSGYRPDHLDGYYNKSLIVTGGLHWE